MPSGALDAGVGAVTGSSAAEHAGKAMSKPAAAVNANGLARVWIENMGFLS